MEATTVQFVLDACGGALLSGSAETPVLRICTDSRKIAPGDLFVALAGDNFDGHEFIEQAAKDGAVAGLTQEGRAVPVARGMAVISVPNTRAAFGKIAAAYRRLFRLRIAAVAGSNGKTTTKELIASVLRQKFATHQSEGSFNNDVGVPLTLLGLAKTHEAAVLETGTNHPGELLPLLQMIGPKYSILTSIGREHLEHFGTLEGVAREEGFAAEVLPEDGVLFINGDSEFADAIASRTRARVVRAGFNPGNDWRATDYLMGDEGATFRLAKSPLGSGATLALRLLGKHQVVNALLAAAVGHELGLGLEQITRGLALCHPAKMRLQLWEHKGVRVLDDAYNANADSMIAALATLRDLPCKGRRVAVLGDMAELGEHTEQAHQEIGRGAAELGVGQLFAVGKYAQVIGAAARKAGLTRVLEFQDVESAANAVKSFVREGDVLLVKASRSSRLERVSEAVRRN